ncbi:hypothetical protein LTR08_002864 [Meristemomyces frigidus]|nr:hypothetical protein LTR08_002864 [Meristemomyces frigidus]
MTDMATRFQPRVRAQSYLDRERERERAAVPEDSEGDAESRPRRKFQATADTEPTFRKPSIPASAMRPAGLEPRPSLSSRRRSTLRENVRVPTGPREFPSPGKRCVSTNTGKGERSADVADRLVSTTTSSTMAPSPSGTFLPAANAELFLANSRLPATAAGTSRFSSGKHSSTDDADSPTTPAGRRADAFDFVPTMNFDDFQSSIVDPNWTSPLTSTFPSHSGGRALPKEPEERSAPARSTGVAASRVANMVRQKQAEEERGGGLGRTPSFSRRLSAMSGSRNTAAQTFGGQQTPASASQPILSLRTRRQSTMQQAPAPASTPPATTAGARPPRKSLGPGLITSLMDRKGSATHNPAPTTPDSSTLKPALSRTSSLSKARRTTLQPSTPAGAEGLPRVSSTFSANTQARANKVKSMQPPPRNNTTAAADIDSPVGGRAGTKGASERSRAITPSSGGNAGGSGSGNTNKRQSTVSNGRASGLGARTISPTDARRAKRLSMRQPPMPTKTGNGNGSGQFAKGSSTPQPHEEAHMSAFVTQRPEVPRLTQPSPSLIPRKSSIAGANTQTTTTTTTPSASARASPEGLRQQQQSFFPGAGGSLSAKSSYQSLHSSSHSSNRNGSREREGSSSRLPTPKPGRGGAHSSSSQYGEDSGQWGGGESVPPVPAIPKAFESPKEREMGAYFAPGPWGGESGEGAGRKGSGEQVGQHRRTNTGEGGAKIGGGGGGGRAQPEVATGRKNNNLQPLRLPPLNLAPVNTPTAHKSAGLPRPSAEVDDRGGGEGADGTREESRGGEVYGGGGIGGVRTPEPKRSWAKTPGTPMTASKASFFSRRGDDGGMGFAGKAGVRSSSSHHALRDLAQQPSMMNAFFDDRDSDGEGGGGVVGGGVRVPVAAKGAVSGGGGRREAITPFASGSLPKGASMPSAEYADEYDLGPARVRGKGSGQAGKAGTLGGGDGSMAGEGKKEGGGGVGGLRRKLSLGWRRSGKEAGASHAAEGAGAPQQDASPSEPGPFFTKLMTEKKRASEMPPPRLPASATWTEGLEAAGGRRKSSLAGGGQGGLLAEGEAGGGGVKTRALHSDHAQSVPVLATRASSWGNFGAAESGAGGLDGGSNSNSNNSNNNNNNNDTDAAHHANISHRPSHRSPAPPTTSSKPSSSSRPQPPQPKPQPPPVYTPTNVHIKDALDLAADDEMRRLSQKRRDVDVAARESEALRARARAGCAMGVEEYMYERGSGGGGGGGGGAGLNVFERGEVVEYERAWGGGGSEGVFFTGVRGAKKIIGALGAGGVSPVQYGSERERVGEGGNKAAKVAAAEGNYGYDDERGDYNIVFGDHLAYRYEVVDLLGKGSFGQVVRCVDHKEGGVVAVKIIRNKKRFHQQALVEVGILGRLGEWDPDGAHATLSITTSFYFRSHLCIVTPCLSINLYEFIRAHNFAGFPLALIRRFARQLLACLVLLQHRKIIHCDLKPENILLCEARKADVRVIDFGSSCREEEKVYTYIQSRFYRSPEVILGSAYGLGIDMWSLGCILAELWTGYPLFPGENEQEQLACIMEIFGPPDRHLVERCTRKKLFFDSVGKPRVTVSSKGRRRRPSSKTLAQALKTEDEAFVDFVARCLRWDPERRIKATEAVAHPFVTGVPFHQRGAGIPDEARGVRAGTRVRSAAVPPSHGGGGAAPPGNAFAQQMLTATATAAAVMTPVRGAARERALPEMPQTAVRGAGGGQQAQVSPSKGGGRRLSAAVHAGAGSKRASNGTVLMQGGGGQRVGSGVGPGSAGAGGGLAAMAARESMGATASAPVQGAGRWRG